MPYVTASTESDVKGLRDKIDGIKNDIRDLKKDDKDFESRIKKVEKAIDELNIGDRRFKEAHTSVTSLQRKLEKMDAVAQEWKNFKKDMEESILKQVQKHTKARITDVAPQAY